MNKVTSITAHKTAEGTRVSITYSVIDEYGRITEDNKRVNRVVVDPQIQSHIDSMNQFAQEIIESE